MRGWKGLKWGGRRILPSSQELSPPDELDAYCKAELEQKQSQSLMISLGYDSIMILSAQGFTSHDLYVINFFTMSK